MKLWPLLLSLPLVAQNSPYSLSVSITQCRLWLKRDGVVIREYKAGTVKRGLPGPIGNGQVREVYFKPMWNPMPDTIRMYREQYHKTLPAHVPYGHPEHMLGSFKMVLTHTSTKYRFSGVYSIHGCKDEKTIGKRVSGGCVRMNNNEGAELAQLINQELKQNRTVVVHIEEA